MKAGEFYFTADNRDGVYTKLEAKMNKLGKAKIVSVQHLETTSRLKTENSFEYVGRYMIIWR